jgi:hypothetical protein
MGRPNNRPGAGVTSIGAGVLFCILVLLPKISAQVIINAGRIYTNEELEVIYKTGSGISGSGKRVAGNGYGGQADGPNGSVVVTGQSKSNYANGSVIKAGLIPPIKPIWDVHMRDTVITVGGDGNYYMTGSTGNNIWNYNDGIEIYRSKDLRTWSYLGLVWSIEKDGGWEKTWRNHHDHPTRAIWAPELHYLKGNYYICLSMPPGGISILKSATGRPEGPYIHATDPNKPLLGGIGPIPDSFLIDPTLFEDDDGKVYFTQGPAREIARMKDDMSGFAEPLKKVVLLDPDHNPELHDKSCPGRYELNDLGFEGATIFKRNGRYYLGSTDKYQGRYSMMLAVSNNIYGPYKMRHESVPSNGGTGFFKAKDGFWYTTYFGDDGQAPWRSKPGIIRIDFDKDGKVIVAKKQPKFILVN